MSKEQQLIDTLKADLKPVRAPASLLSVLPGWLLLSFVYVGILGVLMGPFRAGFLEQLISVPRFSIEMLMGIAATVCFAVVALAESIPGFDVRQIRRAAWILTAGWLSQFLIGFGFPVLEPSMLGKRAHCMWEAYLYSVPPLLGMIWLQRRRFVLQPVRAVGYAAIAGGMIPALMMQIACMYEPHHILQAHVLPVAIVAVVAAGLTWLLLRREALRTPAS